MRSVKNWQRYLAAFMAAMMMFSCVNVTAFAATGAEGQDENADGVAVTVAQLVAECFSDAEAKNVVTSGAIDNGGTLTNVKPTSELVDVTLEGNTCTVTAETYSAADGNGEWVPVSVEVTTPGAAEDADPLLEGEFDEGGKFVGEFTTVPASYVAAVTYEWRVVLGAAEERLLALPTQLATARATMDGVAALYGDLGDLEAGLALPLNAPVVTPEQKDKIREVYTPVCALMEAIMAYNDAEFATCYPWEGDPSNGETMRSAVEKAAEMVGKLEEKLDANIIGMIDVDVATLNEGLAAYSEETKWGFLNYDPGFEVGASVEEKTALDANVKLLADEGFNTIPEPADYYVVREEVVNKTANTVTVNVTVIPREAGEADLDEVIAGATVNLATEREAYKATLHLGAKGLTKDDVRAEVGPKVVEAMTGWWDDNKGNYYVVDYLVPDLMGENQTIEITVECKPINVNVALEGVTKQVPYGTKIYLSEYDDVANEGLGYYYTVNGTMLYQGKTVDANMALTIARVKEQALNSYPVMDILVEQYGDALSDEMKAVLASTAVTTGLEESDMVQYRVPSGKLSFVTFDTNTGTYEVTAPKDIATGMTEADGYWQPYALELYGANDSEPLASVAFGNDENNEDSFGVQDNVISWTGTDYPTMEKAKVIFSREVAEESVAENVLGIPAELKSYVDKQSGYLEKAKTIYDSSADVRENLNKGALGLLQGQLDTQEAKDAVQAILDNWTFDGGKLAMFKYLEEANKASWDLGEVLKAGVYANIMGELTLTVNGNGIGYFLGIIAEDDGFASALAFALGRSEAEVQDMVDDVKGMQGKMDELKNIQWQMPSTLNKDSSDFVAMIEKIKMTDAAKLNTPENVGPITAYVSVTQAANGFYTMNYVVEVETADGKGGTHYVIKEFDPAKIYEADEVIDQEEVDEQIAELEKGIFGEGNVNRKYYEDEASFGSDNYVPGTPVDANEEYVKTYKLKKFTVSVEGGKTYSAHLGYTPAVVLPADSADSDTYYKYYVGNELIGEGGETYTFTAEEMLNFPEGGLKITRETGSREADAMDAFVADMNDALAGITVGTQPMVQFEALKANDNSTKAYDSLVLKLTASPELGMDSLATVLADAVMVLSGSYDFMAFPGVKEGQEYDTFKENTDDGIKLYPQALVNLLLNGDISSDTLLSKIKEDGTVKSDKVGDTSVGAQLVKSTINLDNYTYDFYVTLCDGDVELLKSLRSLLSAGEGYVDFALSDGTVSLNATIPENVYKLYVSLLVVLDFVQLEDLEDANVIGDIADRLEKVLEEADLDAEMLQDALNKAGVELDLMSYEAIVNKMINGVKKMLGNVANADNADGIYDYTFTYDMSAMIGEMDLGDLDPAKLFGEGGMVLTLPCEFVVTNGTAFPYEALLLDITAEGVTNKVDYVKDLQVALTNAAGPVYAVLLKDLGTADEPVTLTMNKNVVLDLNGKTITGTVDATNGNLRIVSRILSDDVGGVTGELKGTISVANGKYLNTDGTVMEVSLPTGYQQDAETGMVSNIYYSITESGNTTTVTVQPGQIFDSENLTKRQPVVLVLEMLSDVMMNLDVYAGVSVDVDGEEKVIYNVGELDVLDLVKDASNKDLGAISDKLFNMVSKDDLKSVLKTVVSDLTDTAALSDALENGGKLANYTMKVYPWIITPSVNGDELDVTIGAGKERTQTIEIVVGEDVLTEDEMADLKAMYAAAKDIVSVKNDGFNLGTITYTDGKLGWSGSIDATVTFDLTNDDGSASDYVTALAAILANSADNEADYNRAIRLYHSNEHADELESIFGGLTVGALMDAVADCDTVSFEQLIANTGLAGEVEGVESLADYYDVVLYFASNMASAVRSIVNEADDTKYADAIDAFREKNVAGLYNGETFAYGESELTVVLSLFNGDYVSSVTTMTDEIAGLLEIDEITEDNLWDVALKLAKINETLLGMSEDAKDMVAVELEYADFDALAENLNDVYETLKTAGLLDLMINKIAALPVLNQTAADIIPDYAAVNDLVDQIYAIYTYVLSDEDCDGITNVDKLLNAVDYFGTWNMLFDTLKSYIDEIVEPYDKNDLGSLENTSLAYEIYLTLGDRAKEYFEDMYPGLLAKLLAAVEVFDRARDLWITAIEPVTYNGTAQKPVIRVYEGLTLLTEKVDYTISYKNNTKAYAFDEATNANYDAYVKAHNDVLEAEAVCGGSIDYWNGYVAELNAEIKDLNAEIKTLKAEIKKADEAEKVTLEGRLAEAEGSLEATKNALSDAKTKQATTKKVLNPLVKKETAAANKVPAVVVNFKKNYTGQAYRYFEILPIDLDKIEPTSATYEEGYAESVKLVAQNEVSAVVGATAKVTAPAITLNNKKVSTSEYTFKLQKYVEGETVDLGIWEDVNTKVEKKFLENTEYRVVVEGKGTNFVGTYYVEQEMAAYMMSKATIGKIPTQEYSQWVDWANNEEVAQQLQYDEYGNVKVTPDLELKYPVEHDDEIIVTYGKSKVQLIKGVHYTVSYEGSSGAGTAKAIITGTGMTLKEFYEVNEEYFGSYEDYEDNNPELAAAYENLSFSGTKTATFKINGIKLATNMVTFTEKTITKDYTGEALTLDADEYAVSYKANKTADPVALDEGEDYTVSYSKNINKGTASVTFTGKGIYTGTVKKTFKIVAADLGLAAAKIADSAVYSKSGAMPIVELNYNGMDLKEKTDYTVTYKNNKSVYAPVDTVEEFEAFVEALNTYMETNTKLPKTVTIGEGADEQTVTVSKVPTVTIKGKGNYTGTLTEYFFVARANLNDVDATAKDVKWNPNKDGFATVKTTVTLTDAAGKKLSSSDYEKATGFVYEYLDKDDNWTEIPMVDANGKPVKNIQIPAEKTNVEADGYVKMQVTVDAAGSYEGSKTITFNLYTKDLNKAKVDRNSKVQFVYDRDEHKFVGAIDDGGIVLTYTENKGDEPVTLTENEHYKLEYVGNKLVGTATATLSGMNEFGGTKKITFKIQKNSEQVEKWDDRIHFFGDGESETAMMFATHSVAFEVYNATVLFDF